MDKTLYAVPAIPLLAGLLAAILLTACQVPLAPAAAVKVQQSDRPRLEPDAPADDVAELVAGSNAFAFDLYQAIRASEDNLFFSPFSIHEALAMTYAGAGGETARQMAETLHFTLPQERLHPAYNALDRRLRDAAAEDFKLNVANAVWAQEGLPFKADYLDALAENYGAGIRAADFENAPEAALKQINAWVNQETAGRIPSVVDSVSPETRLMLANAIYFNAAWAKPFEESRTFDEPFHLLKGGEVKTPMMHQQEEFLYTEGDGYQAIQLPYQGLKTAMVVLLPAEGRFGEVEAGLTGEWADGVMRELRNEDVILTMPKFTDEPKLSLTDTLSGMGMPDAFQEGAANFSGIIDPDAYYAWIGQVLHKAFIDVNEQRTEAAAVTVVELAGMTMAIGPTAPPPKVMRMDRPFVYLIRDLETGAILFVGRVMDPTE